MHNGSGDFLPEGAVSFSYVVTIARTFFSRPRSRGSSLSFQPAVLSWSHMWCGTAGLWLQLSQYYSVAAPWASSSTSIYTAR